MKDTYYFSHDSNAHKDPKCSALINDWGYTGYGIYWAIIELLHEQGGKIKKFPKLINGLAFQFQVEIKYFKNLLEALLHDYELLKEDANFVWSNRVIRNLEKRMAKRQAKVDAGRIGGIKSGISRNKTLQDEAPLKAERSKRTKVKESKVKESNIYSDHVLLTDKEYEELVKRFGQRGADDRITRLANYVASKDKKYKSHYHTILMWESKNCGEGKVKFT